MKRAMFIVVLTGCAVDVAGSEGALAIRGPWVLPREVREEGERQYIRYDSPPPWSGESGCSGRLLEGTREVGELLTRRFDQIRFYGGYACRPNTGNTSQTSVHGTGRALDLMLPLDGGDADNGKGDPVANFLVTHAEAMGVQYIVWDHWDWNGSLSGRKDTPYGGPIPHIDHIHMELTEEAARRNAEFFTDRDGDGVRNQRDNCPNEANREQEDRDGDGRGNRCDNCPADANGGQLDSDGDGVGDRCDNCLRADNAGQEDTDGDGRGDRCDNCDAVENRGQLDTDDDGRGDACDADDDQDGVGDDRDNCRLVANAMQNDADGDGTGNACEDDDDGDGVNDPRDNCPRRANADQADRDGDGRGDACDDSDDDGVLDAVDLCPRVADPAQSDLDGDGRGDACDDDIDGDGLFAITDPCAEQAGDGSDLDGDGYGDACDADADGDDALDDIDVCPGLADPEQSDGDADGIGDACDPEPAASDLEDVGALHEHDDEEAMEDVATFGEGEPRYEIPVDDEPRTLSGGCSASGGRGSALALLGVALAFLARSRRRR